MYLTTFFFKNYSNNETYYDKTTKHRIGINETANSKIIIYNKTNSHLDNSHSYLDNSHSYLDNKSKFRLICQENMNYIRNLYLPDFCEKSIFESVLIEYRCLPHLEFLIRNTIIKLGNKWCHTIVCGNLNYDFIKNMCSTISNKIKIIKTNYNNLFPSDYSRFLSSVDFWNLFEGEKILIYQEDSIIFKKNVDDFIKWDYIGAPWPENQNDTKCGVGNGGISLRTKSIMIQVINTIRIDDVKMNESTLDYMKNTNSTCSPEDVYFCKTMEDYSIGLLADRKSATNFSTESILNKNSFAGHNFWINDENWIERIFENNVIQFKPTYDMTFLEHRGGWKSILNSLIDNKLYNSRSKYDFFDILETKFLWTNDYKCENKWCGIIHCTPNTPDYLNIVNILEMFKNKNYIKSLKYCFCLITLSNYVTKWLNKMLKKININIPVYTLKHPVVSENIILFNIENYYKNKNKKLIQIGKQLRKVTSIYLLSLHNFHYKKIWLTGTKDIHQCYSLLENECKHLNINKNELDKSVSMYYTKTFEEYDSLLSENIVFIDLFDAAANNTVLECIIRNTPIIVNKLESVVEYLGEDYPLYFKDLKDVPSLLISNNILKAHLYLKKLDKSQLSIDFFTKKLMNIMTNELQL